MPSTFVVGIAAEAPNGMTADALTPATEIQIRTTANQTAGELIWIRDSDHYVFDVLIG